MSTAVQDNVTLWSTRLGCDCCDVETRVRGQKGNAGWPRLLDHGTYRDIRYLSCTGKRKTVNYD